MKTKIFSFGALALIAGSLLMSCTTKDENIVSTPPVVVGAAISDTLSGGTVKGTMISGKTYTIKREFPLADNTKWLGTGMDDIIEHRITFNTLPIHLKKGNYTFSLQQIMREDPLQHVLNAGIRVEKAKP